MERPLVAVEVVVSVDGKLRRIRDSETSGTAETLFQILRITKGVIRFPCAHGWHPEGVSSPVIEKALNAHLDVVDGADPVDVNGGARELAEPRLRQCAPWRASLLRTTGLTGTDFYFGRLDGSGFTYYATVAIEAQVAGGSSSDMCTLGV